MNKPWKSLDVLGCQGSLDIKVPSYWGIIYKNIFFKYFVDRASRYNRVKKNHLDAQLILSIIRQPPHVSDVSRPIIRRYNRMYTTVGT